MIEIDVKVHGIEDVKRVFQQLPKEIARKALRGALLDGAEVLRREAQAKAPKASGGSRYWASKGRAPGRLKASIVKRVRTKARGGNDMTVSVGATKNAFYWHFLEFGHRLVRGRGKSGRVIGRVAPRPYLRPAFNAKAPEATKRTMARLGPQIINIAKRLRRRVAKLGA